MVKIQCYDLPSPKEFDLRSGEPVRVFTGQETRDYQVHLTNPYKDGVIDGVMVTATAPIIDGSGRFRGITGINIPLTSILMNRIRHAHPQEKAAEEGIFFRFFMDKKGGLISYSEPYFDLLGLEIDTTRFKHSRDIQNLNVSDIRNPGIKKMVKNILNSHSSQTRLSINHDDYIFTAHGLSEIGLHLVLVSREKDLLSSVYQTQKAVEKSMSQISDYYMKHSMVIVLIAVLLVFGTVKIIIQPIKRLTLVTQSISEGDLSRVSHIDRKDEIGVLANAIDQMTQKLIISKENEEKHASFLEKMITDRTKKLHASNLDLIRIKEELESTVTKRTKQLKLLNEHLVYSEEMERKAIAAQHNAELAYINNLEDPLDLKKALKIMLYRATSELLTNLFKYAGTKKAEIEISSTDSHISIRVEDKGVGMNVEKTMAAEGCGFGLYYISQRMENFDGQLIINSKPGQGAKIMLISPLVKEA